MIGLEAVPAVSFHPEAQLSGERLGNGAGSLPDRNRDVVLEALHNHLTPLVPRFHRGLHGGCVCATVAADSVTSCGNRSRAMRCGSFEPPCGPQPWQLVTEKPSAARRLLRCLPRLVVRPRPRVASALRKGIVRKQCALRLSHKGAFDFRLHL